MDDVMRDVLVMSRKQLREVQEQRDDFDKQLKEARSLIADLLQERGALRSQLCHISEAPDEITAAELRACAKRALGHAGD